MAAGPFVASMLGDCGADVIKIEHPVYDDPMRHWGPFKDGIGLTWKVAARNKRLITLDLKQPRGQELFKRLAVTADVLVENFRPGTMEKWGLGYDQLSGLNPGLVMVRVSGYGQEGPYRDRPGYGTVAEAMTGIPSFTGFPDGPPVLSAFPLADITAALFATVGSLMALQERQRNPSNLGQVVDVSLFEGLFRMVESQVIGYDQLGAIKQRHGNRLEEDAPRNAYSTSDGGWIAISASSDSTFRRLMEAIGRPELGIDPRFAENAARVKNQDNLDQVIAQWFAERSAVEAQTHLDAADVVAGPILNIQQIFEHPQFAARQTIVDVPDGPSDRVRMQGVMPKFSRTPGRVRFAGQEKGANNEEIYLGELGLSRAELTALRADRVV